MDDLTANYFKEIRSNVHVLFTLNPVATLVFWLFAVHWIFVFAWNYVSIYTVCKKGSFVFLQAYVVRPCWPLLSKFPKLLNIARQLLPEQPLYNIVQLLLCTRLLQWISYHCLCITIYPRRIYLCKTRMRYWHAKNTPKYIWDMPLVYI